MKYKVGDKVKIKSLDWYNANKDDKGDVNAFMPSMSTYCGMEAMIVSIDLNEERYLIDVDNKRWYWKDYMFCENFNDMETKKIVLPEGWEIDKVEGNEIILKESERELPKTWKDCLLKLNDGGEYIDTGSNISILRNPLCEDSYRNTVPIGLGKPLLALCQLLVCRDVYRQGWKPDWNSNTIKYCIENSGSISTYTYYTCSKVLSFQSQEVCDEFLTNFKDLIEEAKELI